MKYIRTKDDIYALSEAYWAGNEDEILAEAENIEELCDEAVFFDNDNVPHYKSKEGELWYLGASLFSTSLRFGIWTSKGLIYVAKMNKDGELELI